MSFAKPVSQILPAQLVQDTGTTVPSVDTSSGVVPAGVAVPYAGASAPTGWLICDGSAVSRTDYAGLFAAIGTTYGTGDGSTTFNLPDMKGRVAVGKGANADVSALANSDGLADASRSPKHNATHSLSASQAPHSHGSASGRTWAQESGGSGTGPVYVNGTGNSATDVSPITDSKTPTITLSGSIGPGGSRPNDMPAFLVLNYIIKT